MSLARPSGVLHIAAFLLVLGLCNAESTGNREIKVNDSLAAERSVIDDPGDSDCAEEECDGAEQSLPVLPPLILLDFDNGTIDDNATADEKSKRTVNNGLGYGFERNSLHAPRKYNYYFPAGKTGTTVSIEESISPFLPRTIIERVQPSQKPVSELYENARQRGSFRARPVDPMANLRSHTFQYYVPTAKSQPTFGLRTKLTKTSNSEPYQGYSSTTRPAVETYSNEDYRNGAYASTTSQPLVYSSTEATDYVTPSPQSYTASTSSAYTYVTPSPTAYEAEESSQRYLGQGSQHTINVQGYPRPAQGVAESSTPNPEGVTYLENVDVQARTSPRGYARAGSNVMEPTASRPTNMPGYVENANPFPNLPRYTVENGIRYENKIFWKYPDGRVSDVPPRTYETYSDYPSLAALQAAKSQETSSISVSTENSVLSQGPVQFPMAPESGAPPSPFISAESLSRLPQQQVFRLGYQNLVGQKQQLVAQQAKASNAVSSAYTITSTTPSPSRSSFRINRKNQKSRYESSEAHPPSRYMVNSPNPEYTDSYPAQSIPSSTTPATFFSPTAATNSPKKTNVGAKNLANYSNLQYSDLLNYNPSISQYIKNPASILNVQPTFVQAGNSLIPVIILRVDGVPPIQPKATPNVNLKALLQQYLVQYANSIEELARPSNYDLGDDQLAKDQNSFSINHLRELARLAQSTRQDLLANPTESYLGRSSYEASNLNVEKSLSSGKYGQRTAARPKVKSVQIVEDPRFPNYRDKN